MRVRRFTRDLERAALGVSLLTAIAAAQDTTRVSVDSSGAQVDGDSFTLGQSIAADGTVVAFDSFATNLVAGDTNHHWDVFVHDRSTGVTERVSVDSSGAEANADCLFPVISADGRFVTFVSAATNLVAGDANGTTDVFVHDRQTGLTERVSVNSLGTEGNGASDRSSISADGQLVAFESLASNLAVGDKNGQWDVFVHDRSTGFTKRVSVDSAGNEADDQSGGPTISADGKVVAFGSLATNLVSGDTNGRFDVFVHDRSTGFTGRVSVESSGAEGNGDSYCFSLSADGQIVAFYSRASNLVAGDSNGTIDAFVHDRATATTERVSVDSAGAEGNGDSNFPTLSADGRFVAFETYATNFVAGDTNKSLDSFVHDRVTGRTECVSLDPAGAVGNARSELPSLSADAAVVVFGSLATNLVAGDTNHRLDVFVRELCWTDAAWSNYGAGFPGTIGVPSIALRTDPVLGTTVTLDLGNSYGPSTIGLLLIGLQEASVPTNKGGDLLVVIAFAIPLPLAPAGASIACDLPDDHALCGFELFAQALELDPGAAKGLSFTAGLELVLGH